MPLQKSVEEAAFLLGLDQYKETCTWMLRVEFDVRIKRRYVIVKAVAWINPSKSVKSLMVLPAAPYTLYTLEWVCGIGGQEFDAVQKVTPS